MSWKAKASAKASWWLWRQQVANTCNVNNKCTCECHRTKRSNKCALYERLQYRETVKSKTKIRLVRRTEKGQAWEIVAWPTPNRCKCRDLIASHGTATTNCRLDCKTRLGETSHWANWYRREYRLYEPYKRNQSNTLWNFVFLTKKANKKKSII